jgi:hypothetical protein
MSATCVSTDLSQDVVSSGLHRWNIIVTKWASQFSLKGTLTMPAV